MAWEMYRAGRPGRETGQSIGPAGWTGANVPNTQYTKNYGTSWNVPDPQQVRPRGGGGSDFRPFGSFGVSRPGQSAQYAGAGMPRDVQAGIDTLPQGKGLRGHIGDWFRGLGRGDDEERTGGGFNFPTGMGYAGMMADSIAKNQAQHKDLDQYFQSTYGDDWRNAKNASFFNQQGFRPGLDWRSLSNRNNPDRDVSGLSQAGKQAMNYFSRAGITDQAMAKFMDPTYKFGGNEAWLRAQADGDKMDLFDDGMRQIKNARDTSDLHGRMTRGPIQDASERSMELGIGIEGRPDWDTFDTRANQNFVDVKDAMEGMGGLGYSDPDEYLGGMYPDQEDIDFRSGIGQEGGYTEIRRPPGGYLDASRNIPEYEKPSWLKNLGALGWGMPGYYKHDYKFGDQNQNLDFLEEDEITPNYLDPDWLLSQ